MASVLRLFGLREPVKSPGFPTILDDAPRVLTPCARSPLDRFRGRGPKTSTRRPPPLISLYTGAVVPALVVL